MSKRNRIGPDPADKPAKPYDDFPLFAHNNGTWAKKIRGKLHYFGAWQDPDAAHRLYLERREDLKAGRHPTTPSEALSVYNLCGRFLTTKKQMLDAGELSPRSFAAYA